MNLFKQDALVRIGELLVKSAGKELLEQGHKATGKLADSIGYEVKGNEVVIFFREYGRWVDTGRKAGAKRVPIAALEKWIRVKRFNVRGRKAIRRLAFAIQTKIYQEGIPTKNAYKFSKNGRRKEWFSRTVDEKGDEIAAIVAEVAGERISLQIDRTVL